MLGKPFFWIVNIYRRWNVCIKKEKLLARENYLGAWEKDRARTERFSLCSQLLQSNVSQTNELLLANSPPGLIKTFPEPWVWWSTQIKHGEMFPLCISRWVTALSLFQALPAAPAGVKALNSLLHQAAQSSCPSSGRFLPAPAPL